MLPPRLRRLRRRLRPYRPLLWVALLVVVLSGAYVAVTGALAVRALQSVQHDLTRLQSDVQADHADRAALQRLARDADAQGRRAQRRTSGVVWKVWQRAPLVGDSLRVLAGASSAAGALGNGTIESTVDAAQSLRGARTSGGRIDPAVLAPLQAPLAKATGVVARATGIVDGLPSTGIGPVDRRRADLQRLVRRLSSQVAGMSTAAQVGPGLLGADGPRHYLVAVLNNGEARAAGGIVGAFGILTFEQGRPTLSPFHADTELRPLSHDAVDLGPEWRQRYQFLGQGRDWREVTATPDFPTAATEMLGLWAGTHGGERLDGVLSVDPVALARVLEATGPLTDDRGHRLDGKTFVQYALADAYALYPDKAARTTALAQAAHSVFAAVVAGAGGTGTLAERLGNAVVARHLALFSAHPAEQRLLATTGVAQALPASSSPLLGVMTQDASGSKLSYYLRRQVTYAAQPVTSQLDLGEGPEPVQRAVVTVVLTNTAPASGLPDYVAPAVDFATGGPVARGTERLAVSTYLGRRGLLEGLTVDGRATAVTSETEQGLSVLTTTVVLGPGQSTRLVMTVLQPARRGAALTLLPQPLAFPDALTVR